MTTASENSKLPLRTRASLGSAIVLGLLKGKLDSRPSTVYLMTYRRGRCTANCQFCPQARKSSSKADMLSRVTWPVFDTRKIIGSIEGAVKHALVKRVCIQALRYPKVFIHLQLLIRQIKQVDVPISVSCQPNSIGEIRLLADAGAERIGIALDAASEELFIRVKGVKAAGPYIWRKQFELLGDAVRVFGRGKVSTHLIVGLGETEQEMVRIIQKCVDMGVVPSLFAFTPVRGTAFEMMVQPSVPEYRRMQIAKRLVVRGVSNFSEIRFDSKGRLVHFGLDKEELRNFVGDGEVFLTSGCPDCNRPYYNEKPSGPIYNYPRKLTVEEVSEALHQLELDGT